MHIDVAFVALVACKEKLGTHRVIIPIQLTISFRILSESEPRLWPMKTQFVYELCAAVFLLFLLLPFVAQGFSTI